MKTILELRGIETDFGRFCLRVNVTIDSGITALFGPSGSGKTTILEIIAGLRKPTRGRLAVAGRTLVDPAEGIHLPARSRRIGYVMQDLALFPHLTVRQNIDYGRCGRPDLHPEISFDSVIQVLDLEYLLDRSPRTLSGGEKQRVAFARALVTQPALLLLDEPLANLDFALKERLLAYLARIHAEFAMPMIYVTHSANEAVALCHHVVLLENGNVTAQGRPRDVFELSSEPLYRPKPTASVSIAERHPC